MNLENMTDILILQNDRARHLFGAFHEIESSKEDETIKLAIKELKDYWKMFLPFIDLSKEFELIISDTKGRRDKLKYEGFKE